jgi:hypothetical protein
MYLLVTQAHLVDCGCTGPRTNSWRGEPTGACPCHPDQAHWHEAFSGELLGCKLQELQIKSIYSTVAQREIVMHGERWVIEYAVNIWARWFKQYVYRCKLYAHTHMQMHVCMNKYISTHIHTFHTCTHHRRWKITDFPKKMLSNLHPPPPCNYLFWATPPSPMAHEPQRLRVATLISTILKEEKNTKV